MAWVMDTLLCIKCDWLEIIELNAYIKRRVKENERKM